jgi:BMFP domain-containing protein YqiC
MGEESVGVAIALEALKGAVNTGFAQISGRLDGALQRQDVVERDIKDLKSDVDEDVKGLRDDVSALEARVSSLERKVWMAAGFAGCLAGGGASLWQFLQ